MYSNVIRFLRGVEFLIFFVIIYLFIYLFYLFIDLLIYLFIYLFIYFVHLKMSLGLLKYFDLLSSVYNSNIV